MNISGVLSKKEKYKQIRNNTEEYRAKWPELSQRIVDLLNKINDEAGLGGSVQVQDDIENLGAIVYTLGNEESGIAQEHEGIMRPMYRSNGGLVYQQIFNGKLMIMITYPYIEGYGEPRPPKNLEILRPHELEDAFLLRHFEELLLEAAEWEDFDDDAPATAVIGFNGQNGQGGQGAGFIKE